MRNQLRSALVLLGLLTLITGVLYPLAITAVAQVVFPDQANGSLIKRDGQIIGSGLIGQSFDAPHYFWGRPSATNSTPYNAAASAGSNDGPLSPALTVRVQGRIAALRAADPDLTGPIPVDLVTASASGLDPHISPAAAFVQVPRVARSRGLDEAVVRELVADHIEDRQFGMLGEPRVNVLKLNLGLDDLVP